MLQAANVSWPDTLHPRGFFWRVDALHQLVLLNRGTSAAAIPGARTIHADVADPAGMRAALEGLHWDGVVDWIAFSEEDIERDGVRATRVPSPHIVLPRTGRCAKRRLQ